jgi:hypothetical protein
LATDLPEGDEEPLADRPAAPEDPLRTGRSKRRRHRRSDRRREREPSADRPIEALDASDASAAVEGAGLEPGAGAGDSGEFPPDEPAQAMDDEELLDQGEEGADEEATGDKDGHRAIPSWEEAIAVIINRNLEARARKPDAGRPPRSRGGQYRGGSDRSAGKRRR